MKPMWDELLSSCPHRTPFLTHEWISTWWKHFSGRNELCILVLREDSRPVLIAPLMKYIGRLHDRYVPLPALVIGSIANYHSNRSDFIFGEFRIEYLQAVWKHLLNEERWHMLRLYPLFEKTPTLCALREFIESDRIDALFTHSQTSPYMPLPASIDEFLKCVPKDVRRRVRKAAREKFEVSLDHVTGKARLDAALKDVLEVSRNGWAAREGTAISSTTQLRGFYSDLARVSADKGWLSLAVLKMDGRPIAFEYNLAHDATLYNLKMASDSAYAHRGPGHLVKYFLLSHVVEHMPHIREYDMLGDADSYKLVWSSETRRHVKAYVYHPRSIYSRVLYGIHSSLLRAPSLRKKLIWQPSYETPGEEMLKKA